MSSTSSSATTVARPGLTQISFWLSSTWSASRTGVRLTLKCLASSESRIFSPGRSTPVMIHSHTVRYMMSFADSLHRSFPFSGIGMGLFLLLAAAPAGPGRHRARNHQYTVTCRNAQLFPPDISRLHSRRQPALCRYQKNF